MRVDDGSDSAAESIGWAKLAADLFRTPKEAQGLAILMGIGI